MYIIIIFLTLITLSTRYNRRRLYDITYYLSLYRIFPKQRDILNDNDKYNSILPNIYIQTA